MAQQHTQRILTEHNVKFKGKQEDGRRSTSLARNEKKYRTRLLLEGKLVCPLPLNLVQEVEVALVELVHAHVTVFSSTRVALASGVHSNRVLVRLVSALLAL